MSKMTKYLVLMLGLLAAAQIRAQSPNEIIGKWNNKEDKHGLMEFYQAEDGLYYGRMINADGGEAKNGKVVLRKLRYNSESKTFTGLISPPDFNIELNATLSWIEKDALLVVAKNMFKTKKIRFDRIKQ